LLGGDVGAAIIARLTAETALLGRPRGGAPRGGGGMGIFLRGRFCAPLFFISKTGGGCRNGQN